MTSWLPTFLLRSSAIVAVAGAATLYSGSAQACGYEPYMGEVCYFALQYCPQGYLPADGRLMQVNQYQALFSLLGNYFGGTYPNTFALPDLRSRVPVGVGQGPGLSLVTLGQFRGNETATLTIANLPAHSHAAQFSGSATASSSMPVNAGTPTTAPQTMTNGGTYFLENALAPATASIKGIFTANAPASGSTAAMPVNTTVNMNSATVAIGTTGGNQAFSIVNPGQGLQACVAVEGLYPTRP